MLVLAVDVNKPVTMNQNWQLQRIAKNNNKIVNLVTIIEFTNNYK
jgi:hypothetical protein